MQTINERLEVLDTLIVALAQQSQERRKVRELKMEAAITMIGMPYYWGAWSGVIEECSDPTYVMANLKNQQTGETNHWKLDAANVVEHMERIKGFSNWQSYWTQQLIDAAHGHASMIRKFGWAQDKIKDEMVDFCENFGIVFQESFVYEGVTV